MTLVRSIMELREVAERFRASDEAGRVAWGERLELAAHEAEAALQCGDRRWAHRVVWLSLLFAGAGMKGIR